MSKLIKNWSYLLISDVSQAVINFFVFMLLAVKLTPEGYGQFNVILAVVSIFSVFALNFSSNLVITREVALNPETNLFFKNLVKIRSLSFLLTAVAIVIYVYYKGEYDTSVIVFSILLVLANTLWDLSECIVFGFFVTKYTTILNISFALLWLFIVLLLPKSYFTAVGVLVLYASLFLLRGFSYLFTAWKNFIKPRLKHVSGIGLKAIILMSLPYLWMRTFGVFADQIPILLLDNNSGSTEVGFFSVGYKLILPITISINTGLKAVFPFITKLYHEDKEQFSMKLARGFEFILIIGSIIATILVISSKWWIPLFLGQSYLNSVQSFNILAWFGVGLCFDLLLSTVLSSTYKQNALAIITTIDFIIMFPLLYLGAKYGALGLALAKLGGMLIVIIYHVIAVNKILKIDTNTLRFYLSTFFFIALMGITLFIPSSIVQILLSVFLMATFVISKKTPLREVIYLMNSLVLKKK